jgi:hypothetical protein
MTHTFELETGQRVHLEERGTQTFVTATSSSLGQQQQASSSFQTGKWTSPPEISQTPNGAEIKITTTEGDRYVQIQGNSISVRGGSSSSSSFQQTSSTSSSSSFSMPPMKPMRMGNMEMNANPMEMRMGNMEMKMGSTTQDKRRFCSQCGASIEASDRFCSSCGHRLS